MSFKHVRMLVALLLILSLSCSIALAAKSSKVEQAPLSLVEQDANLANSIAKILGFSVESAKITSLREKNYGYGEIAMVYSLSHVSRQPSWEIVTMRDSKLGWGEIAGKLGVSVGKGMDGVATIMKDMKLEQETEKMKEMIAKEPKPAKKKK